MKKLILCLGTAVLIVLGAFAGLTILPTVQEGSTPESQTVISEKTAIFAIEKMTCAACPITVRKAMEGVDGVNKVTVDFSKKAATVIYDSIVTTPEKIGAASTYAGYPAMPKS
jgi:mercuric ion binding protein